MLAQQGDLTNSIQRLRGQADKAGALASNEAQRVEKAGDTIVIQPAKPEVVYVPSYDPVKAYGQTSLPAQQYYPDAYADATSSYEEGYAAGRDAGGSATAYVPGGEVVSAQSVYPSTAQVETSSGVSSNTLLNFGLGAVAGGLLTAAILWDDDDDWNDRVYYGGLGRYGAPSYWSQPNYWNNNGWRQPANINVDRTRNTDVDRNVSRGDVTVNQGIVGNDVKKWEHNPERRGGVRYRDSSTENKFAAKRKERPIDADAARGRLKDADRPLKAPDLGQVRREGAAGGKVADLKDRQGGDPIADRRDDRPAAGEVRDKVQARAPVRAQAKPKPKSRPRRRPEGRWTGRPSVRRRRDQASGEGRGRAPRTAPRGHAGVGTQGECLSTGGPAPGGARRQQPRRGEPSPGSQSWRGWRRARRRGARGAEAGVVAAKPFCRRETRSESTPDRAET